mgnify:FL=1
MIGDNFNSDIIGGINYNIDTCWYNPNKVENKSNLSPTYEMVDYKEVRNLLLG